MDFFNYIHCDYSGIKHFITLYKTYNELAAFGFNSEKAIEYLIEFKPETIKLHITSLKEAGFENPVQLRRRLQNNT